jgi:hypothetical protein
MPKAILALRSYPMAILMALVLFACSLVIATASISKIGNGGDDQGSGMGGTGKSGHFGDSGFGGTGGPSPFFSGTDTVSDDHVGDPVIAPDADHWPAPWLQREQETARIPEEIQPLIELQRNPPQDPYRQRADDQLRNPALHILDPVTTPLSPYAQRILEMANSSESERTQPALEIEIRIPENLQFELAELPNTQAPGTVSPTTAPSAIELTEEVIDTTELAGLNGQDEEIPVIDATIDGTEERRNGPERIQRPELPPFQRMRPAVDRSSITPPRPQPMRI